LVIVIILSATGGAFGQPIPIDISGSQFEVLGPEAFRLRHLAAPGFPGQYTVDFRWNRLTHTFEATGATAEAPSPGTTWPPEVLPILDRLPVPAGLHLYLSPDGCHSNGDCGPNPALRLGNYNQIIREALLRTNWTEFFPYSVMLFVVTHEVCHAHQHRVVLDAGLPDVIPGEPNFAISWLQTPEGVAFLAAGGKSSLPSNPSLSPFEDFADICSAWYMRRDYLRLNDPRMYEFARAWLPD
jgi:hypothetical protein